LRKISSLARVNYLRPIKHPSHWFLSNATVLMKQHLSPTNYWEWLFGRPDKSGWCYLANPCTVVIGSQLALGVLLKWQSLTTPYNVNITLWL